MTRFHERLTRLLGTTTYREPVGGIGTRTATLGDAQRVAAALAFARRNDGDIGPDLAVCLYLHTDYKREWIVRQVVDAFVADRCRLVRRNRRWLPALAAGAFDALVHNRGMVMPEATRRDELDQLFDAMQRVMVSEAEEAISRAAQREGRAA